MARAAAAAAPSLDPRLELEYITDEASVIEASIPAVRDPKITGAGARIFTSALRGAY
jgi:hypothetical protein